MLCAYLDERFEHVSMNGQVPILDVINLAREPFGPGFDRDPASMERRPAVQDALDRWLRGRAKGNEKHDFRDLSIATVGVVQQEKVPG